MVTDEGATGPRAAVAYDEVYDALPGQIAAYAAETTQAPTPEEIDQAITAMRDHDLARKVDQAIRARIEGHDEEGHDEEDPAPGLAEEELAHAWSQGGVAPPVAREAARQATAVADEICKHAYGHERDGRSRRGPPPWRQWPGRTRIDQKLRRRRHIDRSLAGWIGRAFGWIARILVRAAIAQIDVLRDVQRAAADTSYSRASRAAGTSAAAKPPKDQSRGGAAAQRAKPPTAAERAAAQVAEQDRSRDQAPSRRTAAEQDRARARPPEPRTAAEKAVAQANRDPERQRAPPSTSPAIGSRRKTPPTKQPTIAPRPAPRGGGIAD